MYSITAAAAWGIITQTARQLNTPLPPELTDAHTTLLALQGKLPERRPDDTALTAALVAAMEAGRDPLTDKAVTRELAAKQLAALEPSLMIQAHIDQQVAALLFRHADTIIDTWRPLIDEANEALTEYRAVCPGVDLSDTNTVSSLRVQQMTPWGRAREAVMTLDRIAQAWTTMCTAAGLARIDVSARPLIFADLTLDQLDTLGDRPDPTAVSGLDVTLNLASPDEYQRRTTTLDSDRQRRRQTDDQATARADRRALGNVAV